MKDTSAIFSHFEFLPLLGLRGPTSSAPLSRVSSDYFSCSAFFSSLFLHSVISIELTPVPMHLHKWFLAVSFLHSIGPLFYSDTLSTHPTSTTFRGLCSFNLDVFFFHFLFPQISSKYSSLSLPQPILSQFQEIFHFVVSPLPISSSPLKYPLSPQILTFLL